MGYWTSRGLRGSVLEELINLANEQYEKTGIALVQKIPTPIKPVEFDSKNHTITLGYFEKKSTVDYIGLMQGIPFCFDAKETARHDLPFDNLHAHQVRFMQDFDRQGGLSFLLVHYTEDDAYYLLPLETLLRYFVPGDEDENLQAERKSGIRHVPRADFEEKYRIFMSENGRLNYLKAVLVYHAQKPGKC